MTQHRPIRSSGLSVVSPLSGLVLLLVLVSAVLVTPSLALRAAAFLLVIALAAWSRVPISSFTKSLRFVIIFALVLLVAQALSVKTGTPVLRTPLRITDDGLRAAIGMALRFLVILSASLLFAQVTDPDRLAAGVVRLGIPYRYAYLLILSLRFVPFFQRELRIVREAQRLRGIQPGIRSLKAIRTAARYTFVPVLVSGLTRVESIAMSMKGRCFGLYRERTVGTRERQSVEDVMVWGLAVGLGLAAWLSVIWRWV